MELATVGGWSPQVVVAVAVQVVGLLLGAGFLFLLHRIPRQVRGMGWILVGAGVLATVHGLASPGNLGCNSTAFGPAAEVDLPGQDFGDVTLFAAGALVLLLAQVYWRGHELHDEQRMTL